MQKNSTTSTEKRPLRTLVSKKPLVSKQTVEPYTMMPEMDGLEAGASDYIAKPVDEKDLLAIMYSWLSKSSELSTH